MSAVPKFGSFKPKVSAQFKEADHDQDRHRQSGSRLKEHRREDRGDRNDRSHISREKREVSLRERRFSDHRHETKHRHHEAPAIPAETAVANDEFEESSLYMFDWRGDVKNAEYGSLHRYSVPSYHRTGYGRLVGSAASVKIDRDESTDKAAVLTFAERKGTKLTVRPLTAKQARTAAERSTRIIRPSSTIDETDMQDDFIPLRPSLKRKLGSASPDLEKIPADVDYRSMEGKAKPSAVPEDEDLEVVSDTDSGEKSNDLQGSVRQVNAELIRRTKERPTDVDAWLALIEHQAKVMQPNPDIPLNGLQRRMVADIRLSIYDQALNHNMGLGREPLLLGMLEEGSVIWETSKLTTKWTETLTDAPGSIALWTKYLGFVQTTHLSFKYEKCKEAYLQCLRLLQSARLTAVSRDLGSICYVQVYVLLRFTFFIRDAGYDELAYAVWQALLETHFFKPLDLNLAPDGLDSLSDFWDSEVPRVGEEDAQGWSHFAEHGSAAATRKTPIPTGDPIDPQSPLLSFANREAALLSQLHLPAPTDDDDGADDPFRIVMFSDLQPIVSTLLNEFPQELLINGVLHFMGLPKLAMQGDEAVGSDWKPDTYLQSAFLPLASDLKSRHSRPDGQRETSFLLFNGAFSSFHNFTADTDQSDGGVVQFVDRVLERLVTARPEHDALAEYYIAYRLEVIRHEASKSAKRLLKARPGSLRLYNAYALCEARMGRNAEEVWSTALKMSTAFGGDAKDETIRLWHSWMRTEMCCGNQRAALRCLLNMGDNAVVPDVLTVSASQRLKAVQCFDDGVERMLYRCKYDHAALYAECHMWFAYLVDGEDLDAALQLRARYGGKFERQSASSANELLHQAQADLIMFHVGGHRSYRPSKVRSALADSLRLYPANGLLLGTFSKIGVPDIDDRLHSGFRDTIDAGPRSSIVKWSFALSRELDRYDKSMPGSTKHSVRSQFHRALLTPDSKVKHSALLWTWWLRFECSGRHEEACPDKARSVQGASTQPKARQVFLDGLRYLPWYKSWVILGLQLIVGPGRRNLTESRQIYDILGERELRVRGNTDELENILTA